MVLVGRERCLQELSPARSPLLRSLQVVEVRDVTHVQRHGLIGVGAKAVIADRYRVIELHLLVKVVRVIDETNAKIRERTPVRHHHFRIGERYLDVVGEPGPLFFR